jgi:Cysteine-rich secretory protein family
MSAKHSRSTFLELAFFLFLFPANTFSQQMPSGHEKFLFDAVNHERTSEGLSALKWDANLASAARAHAREMVERNRLSHQFDGEPDLTKRAQNAGAHFSRAAENVAEAPSVNELHIGWMNSIPHRNNIMNPGLTAIGIAVEMRGEQYFAVQDFSTAVNPLTKEEQEKKVGQLLKARGLRIAENSDDARKACDRSVAIPGVRSLGILHFEAPDLNQLPEQVASAIKRGSYKTAAVGACSADESAGFSRFRIAVLLY